MTGPYPDMPTFRPLNLLTFVAVDSRLSVY
jgi:hypothetical protein